MEIRLLERATIDRIAAGEVVERPSSVVKELVENAIDAGAGAIAVEIKEGGIDLIRVTDNGCGIEKEQIKRAFLRHATSKIRQAEDLECIQSLGFRGEALSSIAAVSEVEVITKTSDALTGIRYLLKGGESLPYGFGNPSGKNLESPSEWEEIGAPEGTTFLVRNLFFNVPARKKFLKQTATEGSYIADLMEHMALSRPDISFKFINNGRVRFHTSGKGDLKEVIYRIYGRDVVNSLLPIDIGNNSDSIRITGFLGKPEWNRANRNFEFFFVNGRYVKSHLLSQGLEEGYRHFLMQHKFPFAILQIAMDRGMVDVNVHPAKMEVRFTNEKEMIQFLSQGTKGVLEKEELISSTVLVNEKAPLTEKISAPEPFELMRTRKGQERDIDMVVAEEPEYKLQETAGVLQGKRENMQESMQNPRSARVFGVENPLLSSDHETLQRNVIKADRHILVERPTQMNFFEDKFLSHDSRSQHQVIGQVFGTYWLVSLGERLIFIDQHAAHEKVKYEKLIREVSQKTISSQMISPPIILHLSAREEAALKEHEDSFRTMGFEIEDFGENAYALRSVPSDLYGCRKEELFLEMLDELSEGNKRDTFAVIEHKIASAACKAAVKGNHTLSQAEIESLIQELLQLENPYYCPHGRPTMISMSQYELEKRFKRIL